MILWQRHFFLKTDLFFFLHFFKTIFTSRLMSKKEKQAQDFVRLSADIDTEAERIVDVLLPQKLDELNEVIKVKLISISLFRLYSTAF